MVSVLLMDLNQAFTATLDQQQDSSSLQENSRLDQTPAPDLTGNDDDEMSSTVEILTSHHDVQMTPPSSHMTKQQSMSSAFRPFTSPPGTAVTSPLTAARTSQQQQASDGSKKARYELLMERKKRLLHAIGNIKQYTKSCDVTCANLKEHLKKKSAMTSLSHTDYRNKLDDYYSVKSQIYDYTNRDRDIHKQLARMSEENTHLTVSVSKMEKKYNETRQEFDERQQQMRDRLRSQADVQRIQECELRDELQLIDARFKTQQVQLSSLENDLNNKSHQCGEMAVLCEELIRSCEQQRS